MKFGPSYLLKKHGDLSFLLYFFETDMGRKHLGEVKKNCWVTFFSEESP